MAQLPAPEKETCLIQMYNELLVVATALHNLKCDCETPNTQPDLPHCLAVDGVELPEAPHHFNSGTATKESTAQEHISQCCLPPVEGDDEEGYHQPTVTDLGEMARAGDSVANWMLD